MTSTTPRRRPTGRRVGDSGTRAAILEAAQDLFAERGYDGASIRAIATDAGVDPALIRHFFTDKDTLFSASIAEYSTIPERIAQTLTGDPATLGRRITAQYLRLWEDDETQPVLFSLARSATTSEHAAGLLAQLMVGRLQQDNAAPIPAARLRRITLAGAHLLGVALGRHVLKVPPLALASIDQLVDEIAPIIQGYLAAP